MQKHEYPILTDMVRFINCFHDASDVLRIANDPKFQHQIFAMQWNCTPLLLRFQSHYDLEQRTNPVYNMERMIAAIMKEMLVSANKIASIRDDDTYHESIAHEQTTLLDESNVFLTRPVWRYLMNARRKIKKWIQDADAAEDTGFSSPCHPQPWSQSLASASQSLRSLGTPGTPLASRSSQLITFAQVFFWLKNKILNEFSDWLFEYSKYVRENISLTFVYSRFLPTVEFFKPDGYIPSLQDLANLVTKETEDIVKEKLNSLDGSGYKEYIRVILGSGNAFTTKISVASLKSVCNFGCVQKFVYALLDSDSENFNQTLFDAIAAKKEIRPTLLRSILMYQVYKWLSQETESYSYERDQDSDNSVVFETSSSWIKKQKEYYVRDPNSVFLTHIFKLSSLQ